STSWCGAPTSSLPFPVSWSRSSVLVWRSVSTSTCTRRPRQGPRPRQGARVTVSLGRNVVARLVRGEAGTGLGEVEASVGEVVLVPSVPVAGFGVEVVAHALFGCRVERRSGACVHGA